MDEVKRKALIETLKSAGRGLWFGILGLIAVALTALASSADLSEINVTIAGLTVNLAIVIIAVVGFIAKAIDKYIHEDKSSQLNGIAPSFLQK